MKSFYVLLVALLVIASQAAEQTVRRRVQSSEVNKRGARGASAHYENLSDEIDADVKNRVERRFLQDKGDKGGDKGDGETKAPKEDAGAEDGAEKGAEEGSDMSMSMSMSLSMSM